MAASHNVMFNCTECTPEAKAFLISLLRGEGYPVSGSQQERISNPSAWDWLIAWTAMGVHAYRHRPGHNFVVKDVSFLNTIVTTREV